TPAASATASIISALVAMVVLFRMVELSCSPRR
ncbi:MAG: hypothetical protein ACI88S_002112, partial [Ilumatobacter sp.]